jgi:hypothetical protein
LAENIDFLIRQSRSVVAASEVRYNILVQLHFAEYAPSSPRANWKGHLRLSLISCAVELYANSSTSSRASFNTINRKTSNKVKRQFVDPETGDVVENEDQAKVYPIAKNSYLVVDDDEFRKIEIESTHTIDIEKFVPRARLTSAITTRPNTAPSCRGRFSGRGEVGELDELVLEDRNSRQWGRLAAKRGDLRPDMLLRQGRMAKTRIAVAGAVSIGLRHIEGIQKELGGDAVGDHRSVAERPTGCPARGRAALPVLAGMLRQ